MGGKEREREKAKKEACALTQFHSYILLRLVRTKLYSQAVANESIFRTGERRYTANIFLIYPVPQSISFSVTYYDRATLSQLPS